MEHLFLMFLDHKQRRSTVGRTPLDEWSARRRDLYRTRHDTHNRQISMPPVGFEPTISAGERPQDAQSKKCKILLCSVRCKWKCSGSCRELLMKRIISRWVCVILCLCVLLGWAREGGGGVGEKEWLRLNNCYDHNRSEAQRTTYLEFWK